MAAEIAVIGKKCLDSGLFSIIVLLIVSAFYIFYIRAIEDRWVFLWLPFIFFIIGNALLSVYNFGRRYSRILSLILISVLLAGAGYMQLNHAGALIDIKKDSYGPVKEAALWMKENSAPGDRVLSVSYTQTVYYTQRNVSTYSRISSAEEFDSYVAKTKPRFMTVSVFENHPGWVYSWPNATNSVPVQAYFSDTERKKPVLIIYRLDSL